MESIAHAVAAVSFALLGGTQKVDADFSVTYPTPTTAQITIVEKNRSTGATIKKYDADMTQLMHLVVVSGDFAHFSHLHPAYNATTGTFTQTLTIDPTESYNVYADTTPAGLGQQVLRVTIDAQTRSRFRSIIIPAGNATTVWPDAVALSTTHLVAGKSQDIKLEITREGKPATGLRPYLGAAGHAVFINVQTHDYVHIHPMLQGASDMGDDDMSSMPHMKMDVAGPHLVLHVPALPAGIYRLWFQFRDGNDLRVAPFTIIATKNNKVASNTMVAPLELRKK